MGFLDNLSKLTSGTNSDHMGQAIEDMVSAALMRRRNHERRWYDNNFFDDGYHFRIISRKTGRVIDTVNRTTGYVERAIPRASRQIRGVSNLLFAAEPYPVVYPARVSESDYPKPTQDPQTGKEVPNPEYEKAKQDAKDMARKQGMWLSTEWEEEQELNVKMVDMILKAAKNSVAWLEIYSDPRSQKIITNVYDAFDIICNGDVDDERKLPFITKACPMQWDEVMASPLFSEEGLKKLTPDNKYATSEIKEAYMRARYGTKVSDKESQNTIIIKETSIKEYLSEKNWEQAVRLGSDTGAMEGKSKGDMVMRHLFSGGGVTLNDEYVDYDEYTLVPYRFEPGSLYQVPFIERFIPQNKSVDVIVTRLEKFVNAMVVGVYQQRKGETAQVANIPGGQLLQYEQTPLTQMAITNPGNTPFQVISMLNQFIDEQGASTAAMNQLPAGVKSGVAIESLKATEYANLKIPTLMLKQTIKRIAERMLERADKDYIEPVEVSSIEDGEPEYFDVIGSRGMELSQKVNKKLPDGIVPLSKKTKVRIEIEPGLGLTMEGKKEAMKTVLELYIKLYELGFVTPEAMGMMLKKFTETFGYGSTQEIMEAMEDGITSGQMTDQDIKKIQIGVVQAMKDVGMVGPQADQKLVTASKLGTLQSLKDAGLIDKMGEKGSPELLKDTLNNLAKLYKDAPDDTRRQIEGVLGLAPSQDEDIAPSQADTISKVSGVMDTGAARAGEQENKQMEQQNRQGDMQSAEKDRALKDRELGIKEQQVKAAIPSPQDKAQEQKNTERELAIKEMQAKASQPTAT
jgi:hypothetical protein